MSGSNRQTTFGASRSFHRASCRCATRTVRRGGSGLPALSAQKLGRPILRWAGLSRRFSTNKGKNYFLAFLAAFFLGEALAFFAFFAMSVAPYYKVGHLVCFLATHTLRHPPGQVAPRYERVFFAYVPPAHTAHVPRSQQTVAVKTFHRPPSATLADLDAARIETKTRVFRQDECPRRGKIFFKERVRRAARKSKSRNPKLETISKLEYQNGRSARIGLLHFCHWIIRACFGFRDSDFGFDQWP